MTEVSSTKNTQLNFGKVPKVKMTPKVWKFLAITAIALLAFNQLFIVTISIKPKFKLNKKGSITGIETGLNSTKKVVEVDGLEAEVVPAKGVTLPIKWEDFGKQMIADGVIDEAKFRKIFPEGFDETQEAIFKGDYDQKIVMNKENSRFLLDMLWAFGLANKNDILENGEMTDEKYGGDASKFAATGGWSLSASKPMDHYSRYSYVVLNKEQQALVDKVSRGIFRPCCGNSTHFPDCNHGMAMLGLLELMAKNNVSESEMYDVALLVNSYWFPQTYVDLAIYFKEQGTEWKDVDAKLVLSSDYSSGSGYSKTRGLIKSLPQPVSGGGGCGA